MSQWSDSCKQRYSKLPDLYLLSSLERTDCWLSKEILFSRSEHCVICCRAEIVGRAGLFCVFVVLFRKLLTVCVEECRLETILQAGVDTGEDGDEQNAASSHRQTAAVPWLSVFKVNS